MQLRDFLSTEAFTPVNKAIARKIWFTCAWFLGELIRQRDRFWQWEFYYSQSDMEEEIWLSAKVQRSCISILVKLGWLTVEKKGTPCRNYYVINDWQILFDYNIETKYGGKTWCDQMSQLDVTKGHDLIWQKVTTYNKKENNKKENNKIDIYSPENEICVKNEEFPEIEHPQAPVEWLGFYDFDDPYVQSMMKNKNFWNNNWKSLQKLMKKWYTMDTIRTVCAFIKQDNFWCKNIRSLSKLLDKNKDWVMYIDVMIDKIKQRKPKVIDLDSLY